MQTQCNIVTYGSKERLNGKGIVVMRALMTGLSKEFYRAVWKYFFETKMRASNALRGAEDLATGSIRVPYIDVAAGLRSRTSFVSSITMDFDTAEIHGCAEALRGVTGGTLQVHLDHMFIGCSVHLLRDFDRHAKSGEKQRKTGKNEKQLQQMYADYRDAKTTEEAEKAFREIQRQDPNWATWVERNGMGPLIAKSLSKMSNEARGDGFADTNTVESHNRRGNHYIGTHNPPDVAAQKLAELDEIDKVGLNLGVFEQIIRARGKRKRSDSVLCPSGGSAASTTKKRSKKGGGPARKKAASKGGKPVGDTAPDAGMSVSDMAGKEKTTVDQETLQKVSRDNEMVENVIVKLSELENELDVLDVNDLTTAEDRERRMDLLVKILSDVHNVGAELDVENESSGNAGKKIRKVLLDAISTLHKDAPFRKALFKVMRSCNRGSPKEGSQA